MSDVELADFLLARITEDEAPTWTLSPYACAPDCCAPGGWVGSQCRYCDPAPVYGGTVAAITRIAEEHAETVHQRSRVLAECDAKRRIVEEFLDAERAVATYDHAHPTDAYWQEWGNRHALALAVELLALPYAAHPDYDEAWTP